MLEISRLYTHGFFKKDIEKFEAAGFHIRSETIGIAGWQVSRLIDFQTGPSLEFIEVINETEYIESLPKEVRPYSSGIYLNMMSQKAKSIHDYEKEFIHLNPFIVHVNYDEKLETRGPGWNYLNFEKPMIKNTVVGLTACEMPKPDDTYERKDHPNKVQQVKGIIFNLEMDEIKSLIQLTRTESTDSVPSINGIKIYTKETIQDFSIEERKRFPLIAVILKTDDFSYFEQMENKPISVTFQANPALLIKTRELSWDLLIVK